MSLTTRILGVLLVLAIGGIIVQSVRLGNAQDKYTEYKAEITKQLVEAYRANEQERSTAEKALAKAGEEYLRGKRDAEELEKVARDSLLADNASVRKHWREALRRAEQAEASNADSGGDGEADAMRADIAEILRDAKQADARIVQLQNRIDTYLKQVNGEGWYALQDSGSYRYSVSVMYEGEESGRTRTYETRWKNSTDRLAEAVWTNTTMGSYAGREKWSGWTAFNAAGYGEYDGLADDSGLESENEGIRTGSRWHP